MGNPAFNWFVGIVRFVSLIACLIVAISFVNFATNQAGQGTSHEVGLLAGPATSKNSKPDSVTQQITDVSNKLTSPFQNVLGTSSAWPLHISQLVIALLLYGFGVSFVLRVLQMRRS